MGLEFGLVTVMLRFWQVDAVMVMVAVVVVMVMVARRRR